MEKIIIVHPIDDSYGATKILSYVVSALNNKYSIEIWFKDGVQHLEKLIEQNGIDPENIFFKQVKEIPVIHSKIFTAKGIYLLVKDFSLFFVTLSKYKRKNVMFYINTYAAALVSLACKINGIVNIIHCHENQQHKKLGRILASLVASTADRIICVSQVVKKYTDAGRLSSKSFVVMNGIKDIFGEKVNNKNTDIDRLRFLIVGRVMPEKGYWFLAKAVHMLKCDSNMSIVIDCYGDAPPNRATLFEDYKEFLAQYDISNNIKLHGFSPNADVEMINYDVVLVPSIMVDPFPTTVLEAMRARCLVVTTDHGGAAEIINHGINGILVKKDDVQGLKNVLSDLLEARIDVTTLSRNGRSLYEKSLTDKIFEKNIVSFIDSFLNK